MVIMAAAVRLPVRWLAGISIAVIATHDLFDRVRPQQFGEYGWIWSLLHVRRFVMLPFQIPEFVLFQIVPWVAVMGAGYAFGTLYLMEPERRRRWIARIGIVLVAAFILLRVTNLYGYPPVGLGGVSQGDWHVQPTVEKTIVLFLDVEKYPPSLQFLLMTLGPSMLLLAWLERTANAGSGGPLHFLVWCGRVPLFFYILHLYLIHILAVLAAVAFRQPVALAFPWRVFRGSPGWVWTQFAIHLPDVDRGGGPLVFSLQVVGGAQAAAQRLVA
jgi:uncharacterized membrane protein